MPPHIEGAPRPIPIAALSKDKPVPRRLARPGPRPVRRIAIHAEAVEAAVAAVTGAYLNPRPRLHIYVQGDWVFLSGEIDWHYQKLEIERAVRRIRGVLGVSNDLVILGRIFSLDMQE